MAPSLELKLLPPAAALEFFRQKGYQIGFSYLDVWQQEHQAAFTVAKALELDLLADIRAEVDAALAQGTTLQTFIDTLRPRLVQRGWWGLQEVVDPQTGEKVLAQLGSPRRLKVIYETNLRTAHAEGRWQRIQAAKATLPYLLYDHTPSPHERPEHAAWDGLVLPVDDPWWQRHYPVKAWGCKCRVIQLGDRQLQRLGKQVDLAPEETWTEYTNARSGETQRIPAGVDPAFHYPPGGRQASLEKALAEKQARAAQILAPPAAPPAAPADNLAARLAQAAERIAGEPVEHLFVFDAAGQPILHKTGGASAVELSPAELQQLPGQILLHNHPGVPQSFSVEDVRLAIWHDLAAMHAVDALFRYRIERAPGASWGPALWAQIEPVWQQIKSEVEQRFDEAKARGLIDDEQYDVLLEHVIWTEVEARFTIGYARTPRNAP